MRRGRYDRCNRVARARGQDPVGDPAAGGIELDAGADARPAADLAVQVGRHQSAISRSRSSSCSGNVFEDLSSTRRRMKLSPLSIIAQEFQLQWQRVRGPVIDPEADEALAALDHRAHGHGPQAIDVGETAGISLIDPAQPQRLQALPARRGRDGSIAA